jgi:hypothetical protein
VWIKVCNSQFRGAAWEKQKKVCTGTEGSISTTITPSSQGELCSFYPEKHEDLL